MNWFDISTLPGVLSWILVVLVVFTILETYSNREKSLKKLIKYQEEEIAELERIITAQRNVIVLVQKENHEHRIREMGSLERNNQTGA